MTTKQRATGTSPRSILTYVYALVSLSIIVSVTVAGALIYHRVQVQRLEEQANDYHLATRLDVSRIESELNAIALKLAEGRGDGITDTDRQELTRSVFIVGRHLQSIETTQRQFEHADFELPTQRLAIAIENLDQVIARHGSDLAKSSLAALDLARVRCEQLRELHTNAFLDNKAQSLQLSEPGRFARWILILIGSGGLSILLLLGFARREVRHHEQDEVSLRQRDQAFRTAITPIAFADLEGRITEANQAFANLFGFESTEQVIGRLNTSFHSEPLSITQINKLIIEGGFNGEVTSKRVDGTPIDLQISATRLADANGRPIGSMATFMDVTPRRQVERALRESEQRYRILVEEAPEAIVVLDVDEARFVDVNDKAAKLFRLEREQLLQVGPFELSPANQPDGRNSAKTAMEFVQRALEGEAPVFDWVHLDSEGNEIPCEVRLARLPSKRRLIRASVTDISDRLKLEKARSQRTLEAELLYQAVAMANETDSLEEALQKCVDIVCKMTAWEVGHAYVPSSNGARQLEPTQIWHFTDEQRFTKLREVTEQTPFAMGEGLPGRIWKSGQPAWIVNVQDEGNSPRNSFGEDLCVKGAFGFPVKIKGEILAILEFFSEREVERNETLLLLVRSVGEQVGRVIERKEAAETSRRQHELVAQELEQAKKELVLRTRLAAIGQMSAQVAHELRNPLGAVSNAVYYLQRHVPASEEKWSEYLRLIDHEVTTCNRFIRELLDVTRAKAPIRETTNLAHLVERVLTRHDVPQRVDIQLVCDPEPFEIFADNDQIVQVLDNLLQNALDASGQNAARIKIRAYRDADSDIITIQDTGSGIPPEHRAAVFDVLFSTKSSGTGLGLPICKQIIEKHGGTVELMDELSPGSTFQIRLPRAHVFS